MTPVFSSHKLRAAAFAAAALFTTAAHGQYSWSADFNNQLTPPGMMLRGNAVMQMNTGVSSTACLALTPASRGMQGDVLLPQFWGADESPAEMRIRFSLKLGGNNNGVLGDGFSVSVVNGIPEFLGDEEGIGPGPFYEFDTYDNQEGGAEEGGLGIKWPNYFKYRKVWNDGLNKLAGLFPSRTSWYSVDIHSFLHSKQQVIRVNGDIEVDMQNAGPPPVINYGDARIVFAARTGDAYNAHLIDNLSVDVTPYPIFRQQPQSRQVTSGTSVLFEAQTNFNTLPWRGIGTFTLVSSVTSEWQIRHPGQDWVAVPDTTVSLLWGPDARPAVVFNNLREDRGLWEGDDPALAIDGTEVRCVLRWHNGYTTTTQPAVLRLMPQPGEFPGQTVTLWNCFPQGAASVEWPHEEGKVLRLTPALPDRSGGFVFEEFSHTITGEPLLFGDFVATFQYRGSSASEIRADGISFNIGSDLPASIPPGVGEEGAGTGLTFSFDAYSNGPDDPTAIDVLWKGQRIARAPMPADWLFNDEWITFYVRVTNGRLDLALNGSAILSDIPLTNWLGIPAARLAFYGRTGSFWQQQDVRELAVTARTTVLGQFVPDLVVQRTAPGTLTFEWTETLIEPWDLYESSDLVNWIRNTVPPVFENETRRVTQDMNHARRFYRLQRRSYGGS